MLFYSSHFSFFQEYVGKAGDVLDNVFFVLSGIVEARMMKPGKQVGYSFPREICI